MMMERRGVRTTKPGTESVRIPWHKALRGLANPLQVLRPQRLSELPDDNFVVISEEVSPLSYKGNRFSMSVAVPPFRGLNGTTSGKQLGKSNGSSLFSNEGISAFGQSMGQQMPNFPPIDTHGGTILNVTETEELDEADNCRVQIFTYEIKMPNGDELIKTVKRKLKMDCTMLSSRVQLVNGKEVGMETTTSRLFGDIRGFAPIQVSNHNLLLDENDAQDAAISLVLRQAQSRMQNMLSAEKQKFIDLYPQIFKFAKSAPAQTEIIDHGDGTYTQRSCTKQSISTSFSKSETFIDGKRVKQGVRAFMEYLGPEGGFKVKLAHGDEAEHSEDETDDYSDTKSACHSEIQDDDSLIGTKRRPEAGASATKKRLDKARHAVKELVESEQRYVDKLKLLEETFRQRVVNENALEKGGVLKLFANTESLYTFHDKHLLPQLLSAHREWNTVKRISNVMKKQAPFLKMYSEYTNNYKRACKIFEESMTKKKFATIVRDIEKDAACENLPLISHLICPVQRVMRYQLLLQEYLKYLDKTDADYADTAAALDLVMEAASHANEMMKKLDRYGKVVEAQEQLGNAVSLVSPGRELLKTGVIQKISSSKDGRTEDRFIFLFNDLIVLASERGIPGFAKYKLRAVFDASYTQVCEGDNLEREYSFYIRGAEGPNAQQRTLELFTQTQKEKEEWMQALCQVIDDASHCLPSTNGNNRVSTYSTTSSGEKNCAECDTDLTLFARGYRCSQCSRKLCKKCFGRYAKEPKASRACESCVKHMGSSRIAHARGGPSRRDVLAILATTSSNSDQTLILHASRVKFRGSLGRALERYFVVRSNFCLYSYATPEDSRALAMLPLPGCEVKMTGEKYTFMLKLGSRRQYFITAEDDESQARWMAALDLVANAPLHSPSSSSDNGSVSSR